MLTLRALHTHLQYLLLGCLLPLFLLPELAFGIGAGDVREGYEHADYVTRSEAIDTNYGAQLALAALDPGVGLPDAPMPLEAGAVALGRQLFFDRRLSVNATVSCGMCHIPEQGFTQNELATPVGVAGLSVRRNAPTLYNVVFLPRLFLDGRESSLEAQIWAPLLAVNEMANPSQEAVLLRLRGISAYLRKFREVYPQGLTAETLGHALASYQRALVSGNSRFDRWFYAGEEHAMTGEEQRGFQLFREKGCAACHAVGRQDALFTDHGFYNTGIAYRAANQAPPRRMQIAPGVVIALAEPVAVEHPVDDGLAEQTGKVGDRWRFRVPGLRNVALTAPYMHDGSIATLDEVINYYDRGGSSDPLLDAWILPLQLKPDEKRALVAFLGALTGDNVSALAEDARSVEIGDYGEQANK